MKTKLINADIDEFFTRGKQLAKLADKGKPLPRERIIAFENSDDLARLMTTAKLVLFREVKACPGSITDISLRLHRDRSAVKRDIDELAKYGLVQVTEKPFAGHGRIKEVRAVAQQVLLAI